MRLQVIQNQSNFPSAQNFIDHRAWWHLDPMTTEGGLLWFHAAKGAQNSHPRLGSNATLLHPSQEPCDWLFAAERFPVCLNQSQSVTNPALPIAQKELP